MNYRKTMSRLNTALNNIDLAYAVIAKKHGLTFNSLMTICLINEAEAMTQKQICDALHLPKSTVHSILLDFTKHDYITLVSRSNKKEKHVIFTAEGANYFSEIIAETHCFEDKILAALGDNVCALLIETAERLSEIIRKEIEETSVSGVPV